MGIFRPRGFYTVPDKVKASSSKSTGLIAQTPLPPKPVEFTAGGHPVGRHATVKVSK